MIEQKLVTVQDKLPGSKQLSNRMLLEMSRPHAVRAIQRLAELIESKNEPVAVSAARTLLAKVLPDLKSEEFKGDLTLLIANVLQLPNKRRLDAPTETD